MRFQHTPLRDINKWLQVPAGASLFDNIFVFQRSVSSDNSPRPWEFKTSLQAADYPIACEVEQRLDDRLQITIVAQSNIWDDQRVQNLLDIIQTCLGALIADPDANLSDSINIPNLESKYTPVSESKDSDLARSSAELGHTDHSLLAVVREEIASLAGLEVNSIRPDHSILRLGLDSIDAVKLSSRLTRRTQRITVSQIMKASTVQGITKAIQSGSPTQISAQQKFDLQKQEALLIRALYKGQANGFHGNHYRPTSALQDAMMAEMEATDLEMYFNHDVLQLAPETSSDRLLNAIDAVVESNPILRTTFVAVDDPTYDHAYAQVIHPPGVLSWDSSYHTQGQSVSNAMSHVRSLVKDDGPSQGLFHASVIEDIAGKYLVLSVAHALYDGWSLSLLHQDIWNAYHGQKTQRPSYDGVLAGLLAAATTKEAASFWNAQLHDALPAALPIRAEHISNSKRVHRIETKSRVPAADFKRFCRDHAVTSQAFASTCWALVLAHRLGSPEVVFGVVLSGRDTSEANQVMFPTMNTVALRCSMYGSASEVLSQTQEDLTAMREYQHFPLAKALRFANCENQTLFNTLFIYQARPQGKQSRYQPLYTSSETVSNIDMPVCVEAELEKDALIWRIVCADQVLGDETAEKLLQDLDTVTEFFMKSTDVEVIEESEGGFSFAGLPPIQLKGLDQDSSTSTSSIEPDSGSTLSKTQQTVAKVVATVAQVSPDIITRQTTLYSTGLDSISAIKVSRLLRNQGIRLPVTDLLRLGSVAKISAHIDSTVMPKSQNSLNRIHHAKPTIDEEEISRLAALAGCQRQDIEGVELANAGQVYMLSAWLNSDGLLFYPEFTYRLSGAVGFEKLERAWYLLCKESPILRTFFVATGYGGEPFVALIMKSPTPRFGWHQHASKNISQPYAALTVEGQESQWLLRLKVHHALYDAVSLPILMDRLARLCNSPQMDDSLTANDLRSLRQLNGRYSGALDFWIDYLKGASLSKSKFKSTNKRRVESFDTQLVRDVSPLRKACNKLGISIHAAFLAAFAKLCDAKTNTASSQHDIILGIYLASRSHDIPGLTEAAVPTVNLLPLRVNRPNERSLQDLASTIQRDLLQISRLDNSSVSLWQIAQWTDVKVDTFVNFVVLPESQGDDGNQHEGLQHASPFRIQPVNDKRQESYSRLVQEEAADWVVPEALGHCPDDVLGAYGPTLDVEAMAVGGGLAMGVFGPESRVGGESGAANLMQDLRILLEGMYEG